MTDNNKKKDTIEIPPEIPTVTLPAVTVQKMVNVIGTLPYSQVATLMAEVQLLIQEQQKR